MNDKKHIDRLFQEKLRDFEATPSSSVWKNISTELETKKKKRKIIPLWLQLSGIAASLLLLFLIGNVIFNNKNNASNNNIIVNTSSSNEVEQTNKNNKVNTDKSIELQNTTEDVNSNTIVANENSNTGESLNKVKNSKNALVETNKFSTTSVSQKNNNININSKTNNIFNRNIVTNNNVNIKKTTTHKKENQTLIKENPTISSENAITKTVNTETNGIDKTVLQNITDSTKVAANTDEDKLSITEEIASLEEQIEDNDTKDEKIKPENRWSINPNIAPVYFNSLDKGSSIHSQFNSNKKSGDLNMSYGIQGSYALNSNLSIRTGVNKVNLGYSTKNVYTYNSGNSNTTTNPIKNIAFTDESQGISFISAEGFAFGEIPSVISNQIQGSIDQKLGFIEVPIELEYKLSQKKMGISIVGGFSALFLNQNEIYATLNGRSRLLGKATNINNTSFSANLGIGMDFKLSEKFNFNLEPTFKYQLNTFTETTGNFSPYFIGLYSGLSFKF
jgi:hypothetical protein